MRKSTGTRLAVIVGLLTAGATLFAPAAHASTETTPPSWRCDNGEFCTWERADYRGDVHRADLRTVNPGECTSLPDGVDGRSFANRISRQITVYQDRDCATEGDFTTYPGGGTYVPDAPFVVRAFQIWD